MNDFSIDLETLGTRWNSAIISIGVQQFDRDTGKMGGTFYKEIELDSAIKSGKVSGSTLAWWMRQDTKAKRVFSESSEKVSLATALDALSTWLRSQPGQPRVWGNGATFDITILEHAYDVGCVGLKESWHYTNIRDMRTLVDAAQIDPSHACFDNHGVAHNALDDAARQARIISTCWQLITKKSAAPTKGSAAKPVRQTQAQDDETL